LLIEDVLEVEVGYGRDVDLGGLYIGDMGRTDNDEFLASADAGIHSGFGRRCMERHDEE
jgi:hypothetical protein